MVKTIVVPINNIAAKLQAINGLLNLTDSESEVLGIMLSTNPEYIGRLEKKTVVEKAGLSSPQALNNILMRLKRKGTITKKGTKIYYTGFITNLNIIDSIIFKFTD